MKFFALFIFFALFLSCNDVTKPPATSNQPKKDSNSTPHKELASAYSTTDVSPMDIIYFPTDFPLLKMSQKASGLPVARVIYSRPHKQGRKIFGSLVKYNEPWRLGANEATEIELFQRVSIQNKKIEQGRYILYCIPEENKWTIIFNSNIYSWGLKHDPAKDVHRFQVPTQKLPGSLEFFTMAFVKADYGADLVMSWDEVLVRLSITIQ